MREKSTFTIRVIAISSIRELLLNIVVLKTKSTSQLRNMCINNYSNYIVTS